jgi:hypothetical protein
MLTKLQLTEKLQKNIICCKKCYKEYKSRVGLWKHNKNCLTNEILIDNNKEITDNKLINDSNKDDIITYLLNENKDFKNMMIEQQNMMMKIIENSSHTVINNNGNINNNNNVTKTFNLQFFLNETCKNAMNITDFIDSIKLQLSDLERVGEMGYVEGISNIIVKNLKNLDITQRPVHCTDKKRETMYIKDDNIWKKDENQVKLHKIIRKVADKNARLLPLFKETHPDCYKASSKYSDQYNKLIVESMGGSGDNDFEKEEKIIKKIIKEVTI